jgi:FkbM family methyltransferase
LVALQTLDSFQFENVSLIKIDVEGLAFSVIKGPEQKIASSRPVLLVEIEQRHFLCPINE